MTEPWPQHPSKPLPPIGSPGPRAALAVWPISERALDLRRDRAIVGLRPTPPAAHRAAFGPARTALAVLLSATLIGAAYVIGNLPVWS